MSGASTQIANSFRYLLPVLVANVVQIATLPVLTRLVSPEDFGAWALSNAYGVVAGGFATLGLHTAYERNFFEYSQPRARAELLYSVVVFSTLGLGVCGLATWGFRAPIAAWLMGDARYQQVLVVCFFGNGVTMVKDYFLTYLRSDEQAGPFSTYTIADRVMTGALQLALVAWAGMGVMGMVAGQLLASALVLAVIVVRFRRSVPWAMARAPLVDSLKLSLPILPRLVMVSVGSNIDKYLVGRVASLGGAGIYAVGQRVASIGFSYLTAIRNVYRPRVYQLMFAGETGAGTAIGQYLTPFAYIATVLSFLVAVFSEEALRLLAPASFAGASTIVTLLALHYGLQFFGTMPQITFARKTYLIPVLTALAMVLNVALGAAGIWWLGTVGAAWGTLAAGALNAIATFVVSQRCYWVDWERRSMATIFGLLTASALGTIALRAMSVPYPLLLMAKLAMVAAFLMLGQRLGVVTRANAVLLGRVVGDLLRSVGRPPRPTA